MPQEVRLKAAETGSTYENIGDGISPLRLFKLPEALAWLEQQTARPWTDSELFQVCTSHRVPLHAAPPLDAQCVVLEPDQDSQTGVRVADRLGWRHAILHPIHIGQLWHVGETEPAPAWESVDKAHRMAGVMRWAVFDPPVRVTRNNLVIMAESLERVVKYWRSGEMSAAEPTTTTAKTSADRMSDAASDRGQGRRHSIGSRGNVISSVLAHAKKQALDPTNWQSVWAALVSLAQSTDRPAPLLGYVEKEGVKYQTDDEVDPVGWLRREAFRKRFKRAR